MRTLRSADYTFVGIQLLLFAAYAIDPSWISWSARDEVRWVGLLIAVLGAAVMMLAMLQLNRHLSPFPTPKEGSSLLQTGMFRISRHPIYTGILVGGLGWSVYSLSISRLVLMGLLYGLFYFKSRYEEERLLEAFSDYEAYRKRVGRFWP